MTEHLTARDIAWAIVAAFCIVFGSWLAISAVFAVFG